MRSVLNPGRVAGLLYLVLGVAMVRPLYISRALIVQGDASATSHNIAAHELLFRAGIVCDMLAGITCIFLALALYVVLREVDQLLAAVMVILGGIMPAVLDFCNGLNDVAALLLARRADFVAVLETPQREALTMLFLRVHDYGFFASEMFAGLWLFPFGVLVFRSGFIPRFMGVWLVINGLGYVALSLTGFLTPHYVDRVSKMVMPALMGEGAILLWLVIKGHEPQRRKVAVGKMAVAV